MLTAVNERMDTMLHILNYPQKPLVHTKAAKTSHSDDLPAGFEAIVMIACIDGFNIVSFLSCY